MVNMGMYTCNSNYQYNNERQWKTRSSQIHWEAGQVAFLTSCENYSNEDYRNLVESKELPPKATNHPCVILRRDHGSDYCIITPVSAFSASQETNFLPPWKQRCHWRKVRRHFRSFRGSESSSPSSGSDSSGSPHSQLLELRDGRTMPKPKVSWIYVEHIYVVPVHLLIPFIKSGGEWQPSEPRQLTEDSLASLKKHIAHDFPKLLRRKLNTLNQFNKLASTGCNRPDPPEPYFSSASQFYRKNNQSYNAIGADGASNQPHATSKRTAHASADTTAASAKTTFSVTSPPTRGPWRRLQPVCSPAIPRITLTVVAQTGPNQLQKTTQLPQIDNGTQWKFMAKL